MRTLKAEQVRVPWQQHLATGYSILRHREIPCNTRAIPACCRKGIRLIFRKLARVICGNTNELENGSPDPQKSYLFFLTSYSPEIGLARDRALCLAEFYTFVELGASGMFHKNSSERFICVSSRTHNRIRYFRLAASGQLEQCRQGKSSNQIRNFGKRIGSEDWVQEPFCESQVYLGLQGNEWPLVNESWNDQAASALLHNKQSTQN
eukprot:TRINITY_DN1581_c0_g1_i1.p1 TRINITY_DN1581_c0_g1~~TRINITY_DN1581_c0_g1_i1.p1  ORF type:complete len:207 (+),score=-63.73 TRINITY_DN1581_c0_g1_i1:445-1065(+)